jgi:dTDP-4-dehydrorhamnose reductase
VASLEMWGGVECTVNRVGDVFRDQLQATGHDRRVSDLDLFAQLGLRRLRYPMLWELTAPTAPDSYDWRWADERLSTLRQLRIDPILGLVHHGSGPRYTDLLDERFPELLARYASAVAMRFPWVERYTPINEPLTTARFSALYGHWYPHRSDDRSFARALINQCRATVLAMRAIRCINPGAQLIQTEDLGFTTSTATLAYQARFDNERRWLSWDLLCGAVNLHHPMWDYLIASGLSREELLWFVENPCPPDIIGINHYVTSDRHLDENLAGVPRSAWGGNGRVTYADVEAVRVLSQETLGFAGAIKEAWSRYRRPLALTEVHLGCTREEQLRWFWQAWCRTEELRATGVDVRAVTAWALLGSCDWNSLLTRSTGSYEPGVFDVRGPAPRPTALASLVRQLAASEQPQPAPLLMSPGWWQRSTRLLAQASAAYRPPHKVTTKRSPAARILITGASGTLGTAFARVCDIRGLKARTCSRAELDICDRASIERLLLQTQPCAVINAAGYVRVDEAERDSERCYRENASGAALLAEACAERNVPFVTFSSDLVFDGEQTNPYAENDTVRPLSVYGLSKAQAERAVLRCHPHALVVRTSAFFGPWDEHNFITIALRALRGGQLFTAIDDLVISPTYVPDLVNASLDLLIDGEHGLWHLANRGHMSWLELARRAAKIAGASTASLAACSWRALDLPARRPAFSVLTSTRGLLMPAIDDALERYAVAA